MNTAYTYSDVLIEPQYSEVLSRSSVDTSTKVGNECLRLPIISSNMKTVTGPKMAATIAVHGGLGLLHRFCTIEENVQMYIEAVNLYYDICSDVELRKSFLSGSKAANIGVSIGVKDEDKERFTKLYEAGARIFCIDVAHGHHILVKNMLKWINDQVFLWDRNSRGQITLIAGNIATGVAYQDLCEWGADAAKVGIGPSPVCRTRYNTGVGVPQLYALEQVYERATTLIKPISIIADGGISCVGDIAKALKYADVVMIGSMFAGCSETPGTVFRNEDSEFYKVYGGSASGENKGENRFVEGIIKTVKFKGKVKYILREIEQGLQSSFSYTGSNNLKEFQANCVFNSISAGSQKESRV